MGVSIGIVGATGVVGETLPSVLRERRFRADCVRFLRLSPLRWQATALEWGEITVEDAKDRHKPIEKAVRKAMKKFPPNP